MERIPTDPLAALPPELVTGVLSHLPLPDLASLHALCKTWHAFLVSPAQDIVYRHAAVTLGIATPYENLRDTVAQKESAFEYWKGMESWKDLCRAHTLLQRSWRDPAGGRRKQIEIGRRYWSHLAVDVLEGGFALALNFSDGRIRAVSLATGEILWESEPSEARRACNFEYDSRAGFLICSGRNGFDCFRRTRTAEGALAFEAVGEVSLADMPDLPEYWAFAYPTLAAQTSTHIFVYSLPTLTPAHRLSGTFVNVDASASAVLAALPHGLEIYSASSGLSLGVLPLGSSFPSHADWAFPDTLEAAEPDAAEDHTLALPLVPLPQEDEPLPPRELDMGEIGMHVVGDELLLWDMNLAVYFPSWRAALEKKDNHPDALPSVIHLPFEHHVVSDEVGFRDGRAVFQSYAVGTHSASSPTQRRRLNVLDLRALRRGTPARPPVVHSCEDPVGKTEKSSDLRADFTGCFHLELEVEGEDEDEDEEDAEWAGGTESRTVLRVLDVRPR